jgi:tetratricopeptide (TPR) repeat protein
MATGASQAVQFYPGTLPLRVRLLELAAEFYEGLFEEGGKEPEIVMESGRALMRLGDVYLDLVQYDQATQAFRRALSRFDGLSQSVEDRVDLQFESFECLLRLAQLETELEDFERAEQTLKEADTRLEPLDQSARKRHASARLGVARAQAKWGLGEAEDALKLLDEAERTWEELINANVDGQTEYQENLARAQRIHGNILVELGQRKEAIVFIGMAIETYSALVAHDEDNPRYLEGLTNSRLDCAHALRGSGHRQEREKVLEEAVVDSETLFRSMPHFPRFMDISATSRALLGRLYHHQSRNRDAKEQLDLAVMRLNWLAEYVSPHEDFRENLATVLTDRGQILRDLGDPSAEKDLEEARRHYDELLGIWPEEPNYWRGLAVCKRHLARLRHATGRYREARTLYDDAQKDFEEALRLNPGDPFAREGLASCLEHRGDLLPELGKDPQEDFDGATTIRREICDARDTPENTYKLASLLLKLGDAEKKEALELAMELEKSVSDNPKYQTLLGAAQFQSADFDASVETLDKPQRHLGDGSRQFWRAMALWNRNQEDDRDRAKTAYQRGVERMEIEAPGRIEVQNLRQKAADLSGLPIAPSQKTEGDAGANPK